MVFKRKQLVVAALAVMIGLAGYLNLSRAPEVEVQSDEAAVESGYLGEAQLVDNPSDADDFFAQARLDRETGRSKSIETFNSLIENEEADEASRAAAEEGVLTMAENTQTETAIENLIRAKGFADAVCYISDGKISIVVKADGLDSDAVAKITEIAAEQSGMNPDCVKIVEIQ